ncbi:hypothetical protein [Paracoccus sp. NBH48]|nr:hypothetical protein [Paracoccus sp. NBH48]
MRLIPLAVLGLSLAGCTQMAATMNPARSAQGDGGPDRGPRRP